MNVMIIYILNIPLIINSIQNNIIYIYVVEI